MKKVLLVTRPDYDDATGYLYFYAKKVIEFAKDKNINVIDLERPRLTRKNFMNMIKEHDPILVFFNAHGNEKVIYGDRVEGKEEELIAEGDNHEILKGRITYARACWSGASLGKECVKEKGCFIGYSAPFSFWTDERWSTKPVNDNVAKNFLEPSNMVVISLLKGNSAGEAFEKSVNMSKKNILKLLEEKKEPGSMISIMTLWSNMAGQKIFGDKELCIE